MPSGSCGRTRSWLMSAVLIIAWIHGCIGLYFWLRMKAFFKRAAPFLLAAAVLVPTLALLGLYQGGRSVVADSDERRMADATIFRSGRSAPPAAAGRAGRHRRLFPDRLSRPARTGAAGKGRARAARAPRRHDHAVLRQRPDDPGAEGPQRARSEPALQRPACQRLRRPRPLLHLPHSRDRRLQRVAGAIASARPSCSTASAPPIPSIRLACQLRPDGRSLVLPALHAAHDVGQRARLASAPHRPGALSRQHVRRHARLDQARRKAAAVRYRLHRQPLPRRGVAGGDRMRRPAQPVRRRRATGAVRARDQPADRLPPGAAGRRP